MRATAGNVLWPPCILVATALSAPAEMPRTGDAEIVVCDIFVVSRSEQRTAICVQPQEGCRPLFTVDDAIFHIDGSFSEWLHFDWIKYPDADQPDNRPWQGWIHRSSVDVDLWLSRRDSGSQKPQPIALKRDPRRDSETVHSYRKGNLSFEVLSCFQRWAELRIKRQANSRSKRGWIHSDDLCVNPGGRCRSPTPALILY